MSMKRIYSICHCCLGNPELAKLGCKTCFGKGSIVTGYRTIPNSNNKTKKLCQFKNCNNEALSIGTKTRTSYLFLCEKCSREERIYQKAFGVNPDENCPIDSQDSVQESNTEKEYNYEIWEKPFGRTNWVRPIIDTIHTIYSANVKNYKIYTDDSIHNDSSTTHRFLTALDAEEVVEELAFTEWAKKRDSLLAIKDIKKGEFIKIIMSKDVRTAKKKQAKEKEKEKMAIFRYKQNQSYCQAFRRKRKHEWNINDHLEIDSSLSGNPQLTFHVICCNCKIQDEIIVSSQYNVYKEASNFLLKEDVVDGDRFLVGEHKDLCVKTTRPPYVNPTKKIMKKVAAPILLPFKILKLLDPANWSIKKSTRQDPYLRKDRRAVYGLLAGVLILIVGVPVTITYTIAYRDCKLPVQLPQKIVETTKVGNHTFVKFESQNKSNPFIRVNIDEDLGVPTIGKLAWICKNEYLHIVRNNSGQQEQKVDSEVPKLEVKTEDF